MLGLFPLLFLKSGLDFDYFWNMTRSFLIFICSCLIFFNLSAQDEPFQQNKTYTFDDAVAEYQELADEHPDLCQLLEFESSDYGKPIPLFLMNAAGDFTHAGIQQKHIILINNGIHPGEPCGVDASIYLAKEWVKKNRIPENVVVAIIPLYNVGGAHNRGCCSRANQNGPEAYGFRGNARNLDLNRDFIKADSRNTRAFYSIFHWLKPTVFIDTHTSNGADYQHTMTLITSQLDKMNPLLAHYTRTKLNPYLYDQMKANNYPMVPYVHTMDKTPDNGIFDYLETPRYSTGYTNLFNCLSYVTEAHMLKPYEDRVLSTYQFLVHLTTFISQHHKEISELKYQSELHLFRQDHLAINWELDTTQFDTIPFKGYAATYKKSAVTGNNRLFYDRSQPWEKYIRYYNRYRTTDSVSVPTYYVIPQAWRKVVTLFAQQFIPVYQLTEPTELTVEGYYINDYKTTSSPYEGHYLHHHISVDKVTKTIRYRKGDFIVPTAHIGKRLIVEALEPHAVDSYFAWNYFDAILQQKEWFSAYVFEDEAADILEQDDALKADFNAKKDSDSSFAHNDFAQLYYIYKQSDHYERTANFYPVTRLFGELDEASIERMPYIPE